MFFRAETLTQAFGYISGVFSKHLVSLPEIRPTYLLILILFFLVMEWFGRRHKHALETLLSKTSRVWRWGFYMCLIAVIIIFSNEAQQEFIYFQF